MGDNRCDPHGSDTLQRGLPWEKMSKATISLKNDAARAELRALENRLDVNCYCYVVGSSWTIASSVCHLAFWDQRALFLLMQYQKSGKVETSRLDSESVDSINQAMNLIALQVPGPAAMTLAPESAAAVDAFVEEIKEELAEKIREAGFERFLRRSLHRREHLQKIHVVLATKGVRAVTS
jgi:hypothetical protein